MKQLTKEQQNFIEARAMSDKSLYTLSRELNIPVNKILDWEDRFDEDIASIRHKSIDEIKSANAISALDQYKNFCELYLRLKDELHKRDFSGLPTDKLFILMDSARMHAQDLEQLLKGTVDNLLDDDDEYDDDYY